jgi:O-antigen/teichoic acid export membrane protein
MREFRKSSDDGSLQTQDLAKLASGAGVALIGRIGGRGLVVLGQIVIARLLGPGPFGLYAIVWTMLSFVSLLAPLGFDTGVLRFGTRSEVLKDRSVGSVVVHSLLSTFLTSLIIGAVLYSSAATIATSLFHKPDLSEVIRTASPAFVFISCLKVSAAATRISGRMKFSALAEDLAPPFSILVIFLIFYQLGYGLNAAVWAVTIAFGIGLSFAVFFISRLYPISINDLSLSPMVWKSIFAFSIPTALTAIFSMSIIWINRLITGVYGSDIQVGVFQAASQISLLSALMMSGFSAIFAPMIGELLSRNEKRRLSELYKVSTKWAIYVSIPVILTTFIIPDHLLAVFGIAYTQGTEALIVLACGQLVSVSVGSVGWLLMMAGFQTEWLMVSFSAFAVSMITSLLLTPRWGLFGTAFATSVGISWQSLVGLVLVRKMIAVFPFDRRYLKGLLASVAAGLAAAAARYILPDQILLNIVVISSIVFIVFLGSLILLKVDAEDLELAKIIRTRFGIGN